MQDWLTITGWLAIFVGIVTLGHTALGASLRASFASLWAWIRGWLILVGIGWLVVGAVLEGPFILSHLMCFTIIANFYDVCGR